MSHVDAISLQQSFIRPVAIAPAFRKSPPPVIIVGMHRSGTSMIAGMLSVMGLFLDPAFSCCPDHTGSMLPDVQLRTNGYAESTAFRLLNESVMSSTGANWYDVESLIARRDQPLFARGNIARMQLATYGSLSRDHLALRPNAPHGAWGWKDPRTSLLLPYWLRLFPQARILHVRRQDEAIVNSLMRRATRKDPTQSPPPAVGTRAGRLLRNPLLAVNALERRLGLAPAPPVTSDQLLKRDFYYNLTDRYVRECLKYRDLGERYLEIWYEDALEDPNRMAAQIAEFAQLTPEAGAQQLAINLVGRDKTAPSSRGDRDARLFAGRA